MAIAFDNSTNWTTDSHSGSGTSLTFSYTVGSGSNRAIFVGVCAANTDIVSGVTYAGSSMTLIGKLLQPGPDRWAYLFGMLNPSSGANNVVISCSSSADFIEGNASSYSGVKQSGLPDASNTQTYSSPVTSASISVTSIANNCWTVAALRGGNGSATGGTGTTMRDNQNQIALGDSNGPITPAGSTSLNFNFGSHVAVLIMASFAPASNNYTRSQADSIMLGAGTPRETVLTYAQVLGRALSASIMNAVSRLATLTGAQVLARALSASIMNAASRFAVLSKGTARALSDSIMNAATPIRDAVLSFATVSGRLLSVSMMNAASRLTVLTSMQMIVRNMSDSIMNAASRFAILTFDAANQARYLVVNMMNAAGRLTTFFAIWPGSWTFAIKHAASWTFRNKDPLGPNSANSTPN